MRLAEKVKCPICEHRLFDLLSHQVIVEIKCPRCKTISHVERNESALILHTRNTEQRS